MSPYPSKDAMDALTVVLLAAGVAAASAALILIYSAFVLAVFIR